MMFLLLFFRWRSKTFGLVLLPFKLRLFLEPICRTVCFEQCVCLESGQRVSKDIILPKCHFAKISFCQMPQNHVAKVLFCQNIIWPKYRDAKISKLNFAKYQFATICLQNDRPKRSQHNNPGRPQTPHFAQSLGVMVPLEPCSCDSYY